MAGEYKNTPPPPDENSPEKKGKPEQGRIRGNIVRWNKEKGFGFIHLADGRNAFCHVNEMCEHLRPPRGQEPDTSKPVNVSKISQKEKGLAAERVECDSCAEPEQWEMRSKGESVFGVQELEPVCINKPNAYKSRPDFELTWKANEPFRQAQEKQRRWNSSLSQKFFDEFGEPQSLEVSSSNDLILKYPHGDKKVWMSDAMDSGHWKVSASGEWKEENDRNITAEFIFDDIPGAKVARAVASFHPHPHLEKQFDLMPSPAQEAILKVVREKIISPETIAKERFEAFPNYDWDKKRLVDTRDDVIALQAPGEAVVTSERRKYTEYYGESPDERRPAGSYETEGTFYSLTTGVRKGSRWTWSPKGVKTFSIGAPATGETAEDVRNKLLAEKKQELRSQLENAKKIELPTPDDRLYSLTPQQWAEQYNQQWEQMQAQLEAQWETEDEKTLAEMRYKYEIYESAATALEKIREEQSKVIQDARNLHISLEGLDEPPSARVGDEPVERLQENAAQLEVYNTQVRQRIEQELSQRGERYISDPVQLQKETEIAATPARWYLSGIEPARLEKYGRKLGEGFGPKVAGKAMYLPGDRSVVGIAFGRVGSRYHKEISNIGIAPLEGSLATGAGKHGGEFLGLVENPNWKVFWVSTKDGEPEKYSLADSKGIGNYFPYERQDYYESEDWDGIKGNGPSAEEIRTIFKLSTSSKAQEARKEELYVKPPDSSATKPSFTLPADNPFAAKLKEAMQKKDKKKK